MRKFFALLSFFLLIFSASAASAEYRDNFGNNHEYVLCGMHAGTGWYINRESVNVLLYDPPNYRIAVDVAVVRDAVNGSTKISQTLHNEYRYDWNERKMYRLEKNGEWKYLPPVGDVATLGSSYDGELAFFVAYKMKFYGELYADKNLEFRDELYDRLTNAENY